MNGKKPETPPVGELRASQLTHTFGIGSVVDLPHLSVMVMGLDDWEQQRCVPIGEERLLQAVRQQLGLQVKRLVGPPPQPDTGLMFGKARTEDLVGIPVAPFPRWMRCPACDVLAPLNSGIFDLVHNPYRPDQTRFVHGPCVKLNKPTIVPARFLVACEAGHVDDFPWRHFVHRGEAGCRSWLVLRELGVSGEAAEIEVKCETCGKSRRMSDAFGESASDEVLPRCRGRRPHLRDFEEEACTRPTLKTLLLGASDAWFSISLPLLTIPESSDARRKLVAARWNELQDVEIAADVAFLRRRHQLGDLADFTDEAIFEAIQDHRKGRRDGTHDPGDLKAPEWRLLCAADPRHNTADFELRETSVPATLSATVEQVVLADRVREVSALIGFTRLESPRRYTGLDDLPKVKRAPLARQDPAFVPAAEVRGEGIFIRFREDAVARWIERAAARDADFREAHGLWRRARDIDNPDAAYPGVRYVMLHSFAHALMRQLALECGYTAASVRERIYSRAPDEEDGPMAGVLLYTAASDSEGTLGGLVRLGEPAELQRHVRQALLDMQLCASDPLCAEHHPHREGRTLHGAACHACLFAPETSCEKGNLYLDRTLLVDTLTRMQLGFFDGLLT